MISALLQLLGLALVVAGLALIWPPLGIVAGGAALFAIGLSIESEA